MTIAVICSSEGDFNTWLKEHKTVTATIVGVFSQEFAYKCLDHYNYKIDAIAIQHPLPRDYEAILEILLDERQT